MPRGFAPEAGAGTGEPILPPAGRAEYVYRIL